MIKYTLYRIEDDATTTAISEHDSIVEGMTAAAHVVENVDLDYAYTLLSSGGSKVATFCEGRVGYREWARRRDEYIHSLDDRYDHDLDEMGVGC
jgi:hypothetical protein